MKSDALAVVIVSYDSASDLARSIPALVEQMREDDELVVVDNLPGDGTAECVAQLLPGATVVTPDGNAGFAGGCNIGVAASSAPLVLLLNPDSVIQPGCLDALRGAAASRPDWGGWQALVTMNDGREINSAGNVVHMLGLSWAGRCGEPVADAPAEPVECGFLSGAAMVVRRELWEALGGFEERFFMYCEDLDLSLRMKLAGYETGIVPAARVEHHYEFSKGSQKWLMLERNRWWVILGTYPTRMLLVLLPFLLLFELALLPVAAAGGWFGSKVRAQWQVLRQLPAILKRRRAIQRARTIPAAEFAESFVATIDSPYLAAAARIPGVQWSLSALWRVARALI